MYKWKGGDGKGGDVGTGCISIVLLCLSLFFGGGGGSVQDAFLLCLRLSSIASIPSVLTSNESCCYSNSFLLITCFESSNS